MGDHAGEDVDAIFHRKAIDIKRAEKTFWVMKSPKARPAQVDGLSSRTVILTAGFISI
jgi:hypothetical protein